jgi:hypothetical protein
LAPPPARPRPRPPPPQLGTQWGEGLESKTRTVVTKRLSAQPDDVASLGYNEASAVRRAVGNNPERRLSMLLADGDVEWSVLDEEGRPLPLQRARRGTGGDDMFRLAGVEGARYTLRFRNLSERSYEVIATVDGLDVLNGKPGSLRNGGYVLRPLQALTIEGFRKSQNEVAAFPLCRPGPRLCRQHRSRRRAQHRRDRRGAVRARRARCAPPPAPRRDPGAAQRFSGRRRLRAAAALPQMNQRAAFVLFVAALASAGGRPGHEHPRTAHARGQGEKDGKAYASYYLVGVLEGLREGVESSQRNGQKPVFCVEGRRLEPAMARSLYQTELSRNADSYEADMPVQLVMSGALKNSYRCTR